MNIHSILMKLIGLVVVWSMLGISTQTIGNNTQISIIIKEKPSMQIFF